MGKNCKDKDCKENHYTIGAYRYHYKPKSSDISKPKQKAIKHISDKQSLRLKEYRKVRDEFMRLNPICMFPNCFSRNIQLHHAKGRIGEFLTDTRYFRVLCDTHHRYCEENPINAQMLGLSLKRLDK